MPRCRLNSEKKMPVTRASVEDLPVILELLEKNDLPLKGVADHLENFFVVKRENFVIGCIGLEVYGKQGLLRSLVIQAESQGRGIGRILTERIIAYAREKDIQSLYLLTMTAEDYFKKFDFVCIPRDEAAEEMKQSDEFTSLCPSSASVMVKSLL